MRRYVHLALIFTLGLFFLFCCTYITVQTLKETKVYKPNNRYLYEFDYQNLRDTIAFDLSPGFYPFLYQYGGFYVRKPKLEYHDFIPESLLFSFEGEPLKSDDNPKYTYFIENKLEVTGLYENAESIAMQPPRVIFSNRTELAPFPYWFKEPFKQSQYELDVHPKNYENIDELGITEIKFIYNELQGDSIYSGHGWHHIECRTIKSYSLSNFGDTLAFANFLVNDSLGLISSEVLFKGDTISKLKLNYLGKEERDVPNVVMYSIMDIFYGLFETIKKWVSK